MILSYTRTAVLYLVLIGVIRLMGKRQVGQMEPSEFVVTMLIANLASIPMQDGAIPLLTGLIPILTVLGVELVLSWATLRSLGIRRLLCGKPVILIDNGRLLRDNLLRTRISMDELTAQLRQKDILDITAVQYAILETNGTLSVFPRPADLPVSLIADGVLLTENLPRAGKTPAWVAETLQKLGTTQSETLLLTVDSREHTVWLGKEEP